MILPKPKSDQASPFGTLPGLTLPPDQPHPSLQPHSYLAHRHLGKLFNSPTQPSWLIPLGLCTGWSFNLEWPLLHESLIQPLSNPMYLPAQKNLPFSPLSSSLFTHLCLCSAVVLAACLPDMMVDVGLSRWGTPANQSEREPGFDMAACSQISRDIQDMITMVCIKFYIPRLLVHGTPQSSMKISN